MNILIHFFVGALIGYLLLVTNVFNFILLFVFLAYTVLLDIDHIIYFLTAHWKKSLKQIWKKAMWHRKTITPAFYVLHSPEINLILLLLAFINPIFLALFLASILHFGLDVIESNIYKKGFKCILSWSIIYNIFIKQNNYQ